MPTTSEQPALESPGVGEAQVPHVSVRDVTKLYELGDLASLSRTVRDVGRAIARKPRQPEYFCALDSVSFEIGPGEGFTLLGKNGSGKTTLLSIITGLLVPNKGEAVVTGRVTPLLSVGSAFHPELSGYENAELFGTILGLTRREIDAAMPEVSEFAALSAKHLATPIKRYSEGMKARLAFSTALRFPADLLILDEVLTVADDAFKEQCVEEVKALIARGKSVLFVSHELPLVEAVCDRGIWLHNGQVRAAGRIDEIVEAYEPTRHNLTDE